MERKMRILWFSVTPSLYGADRNAHNGGGWIESLERIVIEHNNIELAIAFITNDKNAMKVELHGVKYYPIFIKRNMWDRIKDIFHISEYDNVAVKKYLEIVEEYNPQLIQVFGSEWNFGLIKEFIDIPIIIHIQGFWPEYRNSSFPPGVSKLGYIFERWYKPHSVIHRYLLERLSMERAIREEKILRMNKFYFGRTRWDKAIVRLYNTNSKYFFCSEALRLPIYSESKKWDLKKKDTYNIITVGGGHVLKGYDMVLRAAKLISEYSTFNFRWILCGPTEDNLKVFEKRTGIKHEKVNVFPLGKCSANQIKENLLNSSVYVHTSYIDNSPNSVCEAQYLGLPIIATNVGGIISLFDKDYPVDMMIPTNDPYYLASKLIELYTNYNLQKKMSELNYNIAHFRHDADNIYMSLVEGYKSILASKE